MNKLDSLLREYRADRKKVENTLLQITGAIVALERLQRELEADKEEDDGDRENRPEA